MSQQAKETKPKKEKEGFFSTALLLNLSPINIPIFDLNDGADNNRLNTSASAIQADSSSIMNNCISSDLMNKIDNLSPIKSKKAPLVKKISEICLPNCDEGKNLNHSSSNDDSFSCDFELNEEIKEPDDKKTKVDIEVPQAAEHEGQEGIEEKIDNDNDGNNMKHNSISNTKVNTGIGAISTNNNNAIDKDNTDIKKTDKTEKFNLSWSETSNNQHDNHNLVRRNTTHDNNSNVNMSSQLVSYYGLNNNYRFSPFADEKDKINDKLHDSLNNSRNYIRKPISPNKNDRDYNSQMNYFNKEIPFNTNNTSNEYQYENYFDNYGNKETPINLQPIVNEQQQQQTLQQQDNNNRHSLHMQQPQSQYQPLNLQHQDLHEVDQDQDQEEDEELYQHQQPLNYFNMNNNGGELIKKDNKSMTQPQLQQQHYPPYNYKQQEQQQQYQLQQQQYQNQYYAYMMMQQLNTNNNNNNAYLNQSQDLPQNQYNNYPMSMPLSQFQLQQQQNNQQLQQSNQQPLSNPQSQSNLRKLKKSGKKKGKKRSDEGDNDEDYLLEMFGRIGWICSQCNNFNYETRNKCNRCGIPKAPKKLSEMKKKEPDERKKKASDRKGDWVCGNCKNLNFSFRKICNRCQLTKEESDLIPNLGSGSPSMNQQQQQSGQKQSTVMPPMNTFPCHFQMNLINNGQININYHNMLNKYNNEEGSSNMNANTNNGSNIDIESNNIDNNEGIDEEGEEN